MHALSWPTLTHVTVAALMAGARIIDRDAGAYREADLEQVILLGKEGLIVPTEQGVDLPDREVDARAWALR